MSRCTAQTTKGRQCKQKAVKGFDYCLGHKETHVDLVAEMEAAAAASNAREETLKQQIDNLEKLLVKANQRAEPNRQRQKTQEKRGESKDGDGYRWLMVWLLVGVSGVVWWRRRGC